MKITRKKLKKLIHEAIGDSSAERSSPMSIADYLESVNYDVDPALLDLLVSLHPFGFVIKAFEGRPDAGAVYGARPGTTPKEANDYFVLQRHDGITVSIYPHVQKVDLLLRVPRTTYIGYNSLDEAAIDIPDKLNNIHYY